MQLLYATTVALLLALLVADFPRASAAKKGKQGGGKRGGQRDGQGTRLQCLEDSSPLVQKMKSDMDEEGSVIARRRSARHAHRGHVFDPVAIANEMDRAGSSSARRSARHSGATPASTCPDFNRWSGRGGSGAEDVASRSISPWSYSIVENPDLLPSRYAVARCLCNGCVDPRTGRETSEVNSHLVEQTVRFLQRTPCARRPGTYSYKHVYLRVPVACVCVRPAYWG